jgi:hypothetical protein
LKRKEGINTHEFAQLFNRSSLELPATDQECASVMIVVDGAANIKHITVDTTSDHLDFGPSSPSHTPKLLHAQRGDIFYVAENSRLTFEHTDGNFELFRTSKTRVLLLRMKFLKLMKIIFKN